LFYKTGKLTRHGGHARRINGLLKHGFLTDLNSKPIVAAIVIVVVTVVVVVVAIVVVFVVVGGLSGGGGVMLLISIPETPVWIPHCLTLALI
jgi:hypothetical protein